MSKQDTYEIDASSSGERLDKVLLLVWPDESLRYRRRFCDDGRVLVDGKVRKPGYKVRAGQEVVILTASEKLSYEEMGLSVVERGEDFAAVFKPSGVHSAVVAGKDAPCAEAVLSDMLDGSPVMLNRLDYLTSGLLLVALSGKGGAQYHSFEEAGYIKKYYLAEVHGRLDGFVTIRSSLDTDNRKTTKVLDEDTPDDRRWTSVETLSHDHERNTSVVRCLIMKGARHQIRAHLASVGHPIVGDPLYGDGTEGDSMRLHHQRVEFPGFVAEVDAPF